MRVKFGYLLSAAVLVLGGSAIVPTGTAFAATCLGNCGTLGANGVVTLSPSGNSSYQWISTSGGSTGGGQISGVGGTNGSSYTTSSFTATAAEGLQFYFNYVTSDGTGTFTDYSWAELQTGTAAHVAWLFTARTTPSGNTSPGFGLPANDSVLTPAGTPIISGGPTWSPLGGSSGACYDNGCGYTDWIKSNYTIAIAGTYQLVFGVTNIQDTAYDSGLAFDAVTAGGVPVDNPTPLPAALPLFATGLGALGLLGWRRKRKNAAAIAA